MVRLSPFCFGTQTRPSLRSDSRHQRQLRLMIAADRNAGRMDLREAGVGEARALLVGPPGRGDVAALGVGRKVEDVAVAAGCQHHGIARRCDSILPVTRSRTTMPRAWPSIDDKVEHLRARDTS